MTRNPSNIDRNLITYSRVKDIPGLELYQGVAVTRDVPRHVHAVFSLSIAEAGVRICETRRIKHCITPGGIFISNYGEAHNGTIPQGYTYSSRSLRITLELLHNLLTQVDEKDWDLERTHFDNPLVFDNELYQKINCFHQNQLDLTLGREYLLLNVFFLLFARYSIARIDLPGTGKETDPVRRVCEYLQDCYSENISISKLSSIAALSPFHLCRVFEREIGVPPHIFQLDIRLTKATQLLLQGIPIAHVAAETGFHDQSHFHKLFKRKFGVTPKQYAKT